MDSVNDDECIQKLTDIKYPMLEFERQIFVDMFDKEALLIMAKGINYNNIISNLLWVYKDPGNLVLIINSSEFEEKHFMEQFNLSPTPSTGTDREKAYLSGGIHFVSTRVLVVDLLKNRVPIPQITGIVVMRAHTVLESCQEAFALRLYRQKNKTGFIKAFSHSPISFTFGYNQVERVMRSLFVTELFLWPRFHGTIIKTLKPRQAPVEELRAPLTPNMTHVQICLLDIMNYTVKQLKVVNRGLDLQEITTENCISKKFHKLLQAQLDCLWHQLSTRTKEYVQDLKVLRTMLISLINDDAVSFYALLSKYRTPEYAKVNSGWILLDSAEQLFRLAKGRVFNHNNEFDPEPCPKWKCLSEILTKDIPDEVKKKPHGSLKSTKILILCQDNKTCAQLNWYLTLGANKYLFSTAVRRNVPITSVTDRLRDFRDSLPKEPQEESEDDEELKSNYVLTLTQAEVSPDESLFEPISQIENLDISQIETEHPVICIQTFKESHNPFSLERTLETLRPEYIVLYQGDVSAVRQIEIYECKKKPEEAKCKVFFIMYDKTVEEQAYLTTLKREKQAFQLLIQAKSVMVVPSYQDGKTDEYFTMNVEHEPDAVDTRKAGGQSAGERPLVVVDMREFRSDLPALLHRRGLHVEPVLITIGDYILTPDVCVERKSVSDLIGSLTSGRLYAQCVHMCRHYARPVLLIEFDQSRQFHFGSIVTSSDLPASDVTQRLQLLTIHFPRLKLVWSPSPYATAELFYELKQGRKNPVVADCLALGGEHDDAQHERYNATVHDFVLRLPGVHSKNIARVMNRGGGLDRLVGLSEEELSDMLENKSDAAALHRALHAAPAPPGVAAGDERGYKGRWKGKRGKS